MKEIRILLNETSFTNICKMGYITQRRDDVGTFDVSITKADLKQISTGEVLEKEVNGVTIKMALQDIGSELIKEIIKRSPIYSDMYYEL